jgi:phage recombination protein Bet
MSTNVIVAKENAIAQREWSEEEVKLITDTVAKNASPNELKLFLYRCRNMGLDPLKPGMIYFVKYNQNQPGTIVVGIDGFRSQAAKTGKHTGTKRGVLRDDKGKCIGAWAEVYRSDWAHPAREEVSMQEYNTGKAQWSKMPETMIKKVAEAAALRMAFPDDLGGIYSQEEMDQAEPHVSHTARPLVEPPKPNVSPISDNKAEAQTIEARFLNEENVASKDYVVTFGKLKGKRLGDIPLDELKRYVSWILEQATIQNRPVSGIAAEFMRHAEVLMGVEAHKESDIEVPF